MIDNKRPSYNYFNNTFIVERIYALILRNAIFSTIFDMLHRTGTVQVCDATKLNSSNIAKYMINKRTN